MEVQWSEFRSSFDGFEIKSSVPDKPGVYVIWVKLANGNWTCIYVGQAMSLEKKMIEHASDLELNPKLKKYITDYQCGYEFITVSDFTTRKGIQKYIYDAYNPDCNFEDPGFIPIEVNLP